MEEAKHSETETDSEVEPPACVNPVRLRYSTGVIGAVSRSIADLKSRPVTEIDRLESDDADHFALMDSIREYG